MLLRHTRAAAREAFQAARLDEARGVVARRIAEHASGVWKRQRLSRHALRQKLLDACARSFAVARLQIEPCGDEPLLRVGAQAAMPIGDLVVPLFPLVDRTRTVDAEHLVDDVPGFAAVAAGVHRERTADRAGYPGEE